MDTIEHTKPRTEIVNKLVDGAFAGMLAVTEGQSTTAGEVVSAGFSIARRCMNYSLTVGDVEHNREVMLQTLQQMMLEIAGGRVQ